MVGRGAIALLSVLGVGALVPLRREVLTPIFLAFAIAYVLDPLVDRLERWKLPRGAAVGVVIGSFFMAVAAFALLVIPDVVRDIVTVTKELPDHATRTLARVQPWLTKQGITLPSTSDAWIEKLRANADALSKVPLAPVGNVLKTVIGGTFSAIGAIFAALIVPILAVYLLNDFDRIIAGIKDLIPLAHRERVSSVASEVDTVLSQFVRGQLTVMAILAVLYAAAYAVLGIRLAVPIGIAAGVLNIVPYVGSAFAVVAGLLMALLGGGDWVQIIGVVAAYAIVQTLEGFVITPRIVGESVGLREVWVLLALFVGGEIFGFLGVLMAVPAAAVLKIFFSHAVRHYKASNLYAVAAGAGGPEVVVGMPPDSGVDPPADESEPGAAGSPASEPADQPPLCAGTTSDAQSSAPSDAGGPKAAESPSPHAPEENVGEEKPAAAQADHDAAQGEASAQANEDAAQEEAPAKRAPDSTR